MPDLPGKSGTATLLDIAKLHNGRNFPVINEVIHETPELNVLPVRSTNQRTMTVSVRTSKSEVHFRNVNEGVTTSKSKFANKSFGLQHIDGRIIIDKALVDGSPDDAATLIQQEMISKHQAAMKTLVDQFWYGTRIDKKGFVGLCDLYDPKNDVDVQATADTTSVWFMELGFEGPTLYNLGGRGLFMGERKEQLIGDGDGGTLNAYHYSMDGFFGLALFNRLKVIRIKNIGNDGDTDKTLTDEHLYEAVRKCREIGMRPTHAFMTPRSLHQLRKHRQASGIASNTIGSPVPLPDRVPGVAQPIVETINISEMENTLKL